MSDEDIMPWLDHVSFVIPDENERKIVLSWLAWVVQNPGEKPNWALVVGSTAEGVGKDLMLEPVRAALGASNVREIGPDDLASGYTDFLRGTRLAVIEEMQMHERKALMNRLKPLLAAPPHTLRVNIKFMPQYEIPNILAAIFFTNMENGLAISSMDRRYFVTWNNGSPRPADYYSELVEWYKGGGAAAAGAWLKAFDVSRFDAKGRAPASAAKAAMRKASRSIFDEVLEDAIADKDGPFAHHFFALDEVVAYLEHRIGDRPKISPQKVSQALKKLGMHHIERLTLGEHPAGTHAPLLKNARMHQVFGRAADEVGLDSAELRAAFWAERVDPEAMFQ